jgi:cation-transporting P-type ATPase C
VRANPVCAALLAVRDLSWMALRTDDQNYHFAIGTDLIGIGLGATGILSPATGGLTHIAHTLGILAHSSRLLGFEAPTPRR